MSNTDDFSDRQLLQPQIVIFIFFHTLLTNETNERVSFVIKTWEYSLVIAVAVYN